MICGVHRNKFFYIDNVLIRNSSLARSRLPSAQFQTRNGFLIADFKSSVDPILGAPLRKALKSNKIFEGGVYAGLWYHKDIFYRVFEHSTPTPGPKRLQYMPLPLPKSGWVTAFNAMPSTVKFSDDMSFDEAIDELMMFSAEDRYYSSIGKVYSISLDDMAKCAELAENEEFDQINALWDCQSVGEIKVQKVKMAELPIHSWNAITDL